MAASVPAPTTTRGDGAAAPARRAIPLPPAAEAIERAAAAHASAMSAAERCAAAAGRLRRARHGLARIDGIIARETSRYLRERDETRGRLLQRREAASAAWARHAGAMLDLGRARDEYRACRAYVAELIRAFRIPPDRAESLLASLANMSLGAAVRIVEGAHASPLTPDEQRAIAERARAGEPAVALAEEYGVGRTALWIARTRVKHFGDGGRAGTPEAPGPGGAAEAVPGCPDVPDVVASAIAALGAARSRLQEASRAAAEARRALKEARAPYQDTRFALGMRRIGHLIFVGHMRTARRRLKAVAQRLEREWREAARDLGASLARWADARRSLALLAGTLSPAELEAAVEEVMGALETDRSTAMVLLGAASRRRRLGRAVEERIREALRKGYPQRVVAALCVVSERTVRSVAGSLSAACPWDLCEQFAKVPGVTGTDAPPP